MSEFCCAMGPNLDLIEKEYFMKSINLADTRLIETISNENFFSTIAFLKSSPLKGQRTFTNGPLTFIFAGDLIEYNEVPWKEVVTNFKNSTYSWFAKLRGHFAFGVINTVTNKVFLISDERSQQPLNYGFVDNYFVFSTNISTFSTLPSVPEFNEEWLYECMFFNFPIFETTCLKGVERLTSALILEVDLNTRAIKKTKYKRQYSSNKHLLSGEKAYSEGIKIFKKVIPKYFDRKNSNYVAFTGGFDSRTLVSLTPKETDVVTYTYGTSKADDLKVVSKISKKLKLKNKQIRFEKKLEKELPNLIYDSIRLSNGIGTILRSTLPYVYRTLYNDNDTKNSILISGIAGDFMRGDGNTVGATISSPIISLGMASFFKKGNIEINKENYSDVFKKNYDQFELHVEKTLKRIENLYGSHHNPQTFMLYDIYEVFTKYFGGEMAIANNYFTFRAPYLDKDVIKFGFSSKISNLGLSPYLHRNKKYHNYKKNVFQTKLIGTNSQYKNTYIRGMPIWIFSKNNYLFFKISKIFVRGIAYFKRERLKSTPLEDWNYWFKNSLNEEFDTILHRDCLLTKYIDFKNIEKIKKSDNILFISKIVTTEILLNLIKNKWDINKT